MKHAIVKELQLKKRVIRGWLVVKELSGGENNIGRGPLCGGPEGRMYGVLNSNNLKQLKYFKHE